MADESLDINRAGGDPQEVRRVNWREVFGFTHIFKSFRLSRHMTKMVIAVLAVVLTWGWGNLLDIVFSPFSGVYVQPQQGGIVTAPDAYWCTADFAQWRKNSKEAVQNQLAGMAQARLVGDKLPYDKTEKAAEAAKDKPGTVRAQLRDVFAEDLKEAVKQAKSRFEDAEKAAKDIKEDKDRAKFITDARKAREDAIGQANENYITSVQAVELLQAQDPFNTFANYEQHYFRQAVDAVLHGNILTGFNTIRQQQQQVDAGEVPVAGRLQAAQGQQQDPLGLLAAITMMGYGLLWMVSQHWVYALVFGLPVLFVWAVAGGAIARAAALQATRDEKAGVGECVKFSARKVVSFLASPLVPIIVFLAVGFFTSLLPAVLGWIPWFGPIWIGLTFGVVLLVSVLLALLLIGLIAGGVLMGPTVAVEGSDTFDACTRSYQFVMARPWRAALYGLVAAGYGAILYLFVRFLLTLVLMVSHWIVSIMTFGGGGSVRPGASHWDLIWPAPTFQNWFRGDVLPGGLYTGTGSVFFTSGDWIGSWLMWLWVALVGAVLIGWVISYVISASTMIYLLLRRAEDATDLKEVYVEEPEETEAPAPVAAPAATAPAAEPPAAGETSPATNDAKPADAAAPSAPPAGPETGEPKTT